MQTKGGASPLFLLCARVFKRPAGAGIKDARRALPRLQTQGADQRNHRSVISAKLQTWVKDFSAFLARHRIESFAHGGIGTDAAGDDQVP